VVDIFLTIFLVPFIAFKFAFAFAVWYYGIAWLISSEKWEEMARSLKDLWR
jgi:hypothetical protein